MAAYPFVSNWLYENTQDEIVVEYDQDIEDTGNSELELQKEEARKYNESLTTSNVILSDPFDPDALNETFSLDYENTLNVSTNGVMAYLEIPSIDLIVSIYHGTGTRALEAGVGHLEGTSLPIGGTGTHCVLSAHTGLPGKKLFTDLELMEENDVFYIHVLDEVLAYSVDQIKVVTPENTEDLKIDLEQDYVTLITCTPYGINSHRLLVRGHRIPYVEPDTEVTSHQGSQWMRQYLYGILSGVIILLVMLIGYALYRRITYER